MSVKVISFDAAHTLMDVRWQPGAFACDAAEAFGLALDRQVAGETYDRLLATRWKEYMALNATRDREAGDRFWDELTHDWLTGLGTGADGAELAAFARGRMYTEEAGCFLPYTDTIAAINAMKAAGFRLVVVSNWDYSLERTLIALGMRDPFEHVFASLECGVEKPDPGLFRIVEQAIGAEPDEILHVGDNPVDDLQGAKDAGWHAALLDRTLTASERPRIPSLLHIPEALAWIG